MHSISYRWFYANKGGEDLWRQQAYRIVVVFCFPSFFLLLCYHEWIFGVFCFRDCSFFFLPIESNSPGKLLLCFRKETVAKNRSVTQTLYLSWLGKITRSVWWSILGLWAVSNICERWYKMPGGEKGIRPHSFAGEFLSKYCMACLIEITCVLTGRMMLVFFSACI